MRPALALGLAVVCLAAGSRAEDGPMRGHVSKLESPAGYFHIVRAWHTPSAGKVPPVDAAGRPELQLHGMYVDETVILRAASDAGGFSPEDRERAAHVLREPATGNEHAVEPRTLDLLYRIQTHFHAQEIRVMSAYRTPRKGNSQGLHALGRAVDFVVPGVADDEVARFARELGFAGVGLYPIGSFVHVDCRARSYFWIDRSGPRHKSRERGVFLDIAKRADDEARARGELFTAEAGEDDEE